MTVSAPYTNRHLKTICLYVVFCTAFLLTAPAMIAQEVKTFEFILENGVLNRGPTRVQVQQGGRVTLIWRSDAPVEVHLHGYNKLLNIVPGKPANMIVDCIATGRFPISLHGKGSSGHRHKPVTYLEVHPK